MSEAQPVRIGAERHGSGHPSTDVTAGSPSDGAVGRLSWLDGLRGLAAAAVLLHHYGVWGLVPGGSVVARNFDLGVYGVMVFFLISGWIIPASLHRRGDVRGFWIGRLFRIYPLVVVVVTLDLLLPGGYSVVRSQLGEDPFWSSLANLTLSADLVGAKSALGVLWTLAFEMLFYHLVTALFVLRRPGASPALAATMTLLALVFATVGGGVLDMDDRLSSSLRHGLFVTTFVATALGLGLVMSGRTLGARLGALGLAAWGLALMVTSARVPRVECSVILATMFAGTVLHDLRAGTPRESRRACTLRIEPVAVARVVMARVVIAWVITGSALAGYLFTQGRHASPDWSTNWRAFVLPYLAAWATFFVGLLLSRRRWPRALVRLGTISYSVYILHVPVTWFVYWLKDTSGSWPQVLTSDAGMFLLRIAVTLGLATLSYRYVELPGQRLGRRAAEHLGSGRGRRAANPGQR